MADCLQVECVPFPAHHKRPSRTPCQASCCQSKVVVFLDPPESTLPEAGLKVVSPVVPAPDRLSSPPAVHS